MHLGAGVRARAVALVSTVLLATCDVALGAATNEEYALLVFANRVRSDPKAFGILYPTVPPLVWNDGLAAAARAHSTDMAVNRCYQHDSCNGRPWWKRISSYYPGWTNLGENIIAGGNPEQMHDGWMDSTGHRANILSGSFAEFGAGIALGDHGFGPISFGTEDFGTRGLLSLRTLPAIPAAAVLPRTGIAPARHLLANFYDHDGPPRAVRARVGSSCVELQLETGRAAHGTYVATRTFSGTGCVPLVFEAVKGDGSLHRFPATGAILIGVGDAECAQRTDEEPSGSCGTAEPGPLPGASPTPAPAPAPTPAPADGATLDGLRVVLAPARAGAGRDHVLVTAMLHDLPDFDPTGQPVHIAVHLERGAWSRALPATCGARACIKRSAGGKVFRARYGAGGPQLTFARRPNGAWQMRFASHRESLGELAPGPASVVVSIGDLVLTGAGDVGSRRGRFVLE